MIVSRENLAIVSGLLTAICVVPYLRDIYRGTTRPQRMSWFVFAALSVVAAYSQFADGAIAGAWLASGSALGFTLVFLASLRHGEGGTSRRDWLVLSVAMAGLVVSLAIDRPVIAVLAVIAAELAAASLTARKAARDPDSETPATWLIDGLAGFVAILAVSQMSLTELLYPVHHVVVNLWVLTAILVGRRVDAQQNAVRSWPS